MSYQKLKDIDIIDFQSNLISSLELPLVSANFSDDLNDQVHEFCNALINTLDVHASVISKELVAQPKVPWFTNELRKPKRKCRRLERLMRKFGLESDKQGFRIICQEYFPLLKVFQSACYSGHVSDCTGDSRKLLQVVKSLCRKSCGNTLPEYTNSVQLATFHLFGKLLKKLLLINFYVIVKKMSYF